MRAFYGLIRWLSVVFLIGPAVSLAVLAQPSFDDFFEQHPSPMWVVDPQTGEIVEANTAAKAFYGFDQLVGMQIEQINIFSLSQIKQELSAVSQDIRNHLFVRHRLASGGVKMMGVYTQEYSFDDRQLLVSSLYDASDFIGPARRHYVASVEEQVDLQTAEIQQSKELIRWLAIGASLLQGAAIVILVILVVRLKRAQKERKYLVDELSFRNKELERLSHVMAHHFQEPSRRLVSFAQRLEKTMSQVEDADARLSIDFINSQAKHLRNLVSDVQRYLSFDSAPTASESLDARAILEEVYQTDPVLKQARDESALTISGRLPKVQFDQRRLAYLFKVLLENAWYYRRIEKPLHIIVSAKQSEDRVIFRVADNGQGIAPEYREQVFEMFTRLVPSSARYPGTGMGLALVVKVLRMANGHVHIEESAEGGACFVFDLPRARNSDGR
ncbi:ATP-binding protein [Vreelandella rituensis]|uniref:histidine kinase n=1 Tax=Vreelandella rituensis TaxID=2282306 RepID=A0A368TYV6_9GAMM|nr:ATP-binding protein [Halomonas rituensis]RCV89924.1 PAS domain-containing protein [Halomonas rituensis]